MNKANAIIFIAIALFLAGGLYAYTLSRQAAVPYVETSGTGTTSMGTGSGTGAGAATSTVVAIALLDTTGNGVGKPRGCDTVTIAMRTLPYTTAPLAAALKELFAYPEGTQPSIQYNFIARTAKTLAFDHATVENGTANIYLTGSLSGLAGICDDSRAAIQLEETALQFPTVQKVQLYLNGNPTTLTPNEKGE